MAQCGHWSTGGHVYNIDCCLLMTGETGEWRSVGTGLQVDIGTGVGQAVAVGHSLLSYSVSDDIITNTEVQWLALYVCVCGDHVVCGSCLYVGSDVFVLVRCVCVGLMRMCS